MVDGPDQMLPINRPPLQHLHAIDQTQEIYHKFNYIPLCLYILDYMALSKIFYGLCFSMLLLGLVHAQLSTTFYATTCPKALSTIRTAVLKAVVKEHRMGASLLRLHFHDCFVNACFSYPSPFLSHTDIHAHTRVGKEEGY
jgi:hypothetical protein